MQRPGKTALPAAGEGSANPAKSGVQKCRLWKLSGGAPTDGKPLGRSASSEAQSADSRRLQDYAPCPVCTTLADKLRAALRWADGRCDARDEVVTTSSLAHAAALGGLAGRVSIIAAELGEHALAHGARR